MFCSKCGKEVNDNAAYCRNCGNKLKNTKKYDFKSWIKNFKIVLIISIIGMIITALTSSGTGFINVIWQISRIVTILAISIDIILFLVCTVISIKNKEKVPIWFTIIQGIILAFIIINAIAGYIDKKQKERIEENIKNYNYQTKNSSYITLDEFNEVQIGMTYDEVVEIIGGEGDLIVQDAYTQTYSWEPASSSDMYSVTMTFNNGILSSKMKI